MNVVNLILAIFFSMLSIGFFFWMKEILKKSGYKVSGFVSPADYVRMFDLVSGTEDRSKKRKYVTLLLASIASPVLMFVFFITGAESVDEWQCRRYNDYLAHSVQGVVVEKYIDQPNHALKTLTINVNGSTFKETELTLAIPELFDFVEKGDTIFKEAESPYVLVKGTNGETQFSDLDNPCNISKDKL
ncbi:hypothetical protein [Pontibacter burrus]|uniref:Uncharacterized protein n=1 Tax=Pontibacter burrus TaxID=2704466 RepID=A0A6B3LJD3_9BACT|nr:hypothetical protein [Pontibacter burrus]NEM96083.1 hypothetical protein [Pontibacter burrus]